MEKQLISNPVITPADGNKIIHYCWFGGKPLNKLAKKCVKSWEKNLPGYKIVRWDETNFDVNINEFCAEAYKQKKWAFVADVARCYVLKKYGGLYFDTDMFVSQNIDHILAGGFAAGWESDYNVAAGIIWVRDKDNEIMNELWDYYENNVFDLANVYAFSIPTLLTGILQKRYSLQYYQDGIQCLRDDTIIYPADYFYPIGSDGKDNKTENSCMIHYYMGSWLSRSEQLRAKFKAAFGEKLGLFILRILVLGKHFLKKILSILAKPFYRHKQLRDFQAFDEKWISEFDDRCSKISPENYIALYCKEWFGVGNATMQLFDCSLGIEEIHSDILREHVAKYIVSTGVKLVVFSGFAIGWSKLLDRIHELSPDIKFKVLWHGGMALISEYYDWEMLKEILTMLKMGTIHSIAFVKKSLYDFFIAKGFHVEFISNRFELDKDFTKPVKTKSNDGELKIGLYASGDRWVKNFYNQLCAASMFDNAEINCVPLSDKTVILSKMLGINLSGSYSTISHDKMLSLMSKNDINFYTTFTECSPVIPLESLELGVPCITGNNHHYWEGTELEDYLVVDSVDNIGEIYKKAMYALEHKDRIIELFDQWKVKNNAESIESVKRFLEL